MNNMCESLYRKTFDVRQYSASWILLWVQQYKAGADWLFKVNYPLWVSQPGKLSLPSLMGRQMSSNLMDYAALQGRTGSSNWPWKSRQAGPICSGVTRNSVGAFTNIQAQPFLPICGPVAPLPRTTLSFTLLLFVTLCLAPFSPILITLSHRRNNGEKVEGDHVRLHCTRICCRPTPPPFSVLAVCSQFAHFLTKNTKSV